MENLKKIKKNQKIKKQLKRFFSIVFILLFIFYLYGFAIERKSLEINKINFNNNNIPKGFNPSRIVFVSDIHYGPFYNRADLVKLINEINALRPTIIILGGDFVYSDKKYIKECIQELKRLNSDLGIYAVLGSHDYKENKELTIQYLKDNNIKLLLNESEWIKNNDSKIKIGGVDDLDYGYPHHKPMLDDVAKEDFFILISHNPDYAIKADNEKIDLILSGHTHGGQVTFFGLFAPFTNSEFGNKFRHGMIDLKFSQVFVTKGIGTTYIPIRFFAKPELTVINLKN